MPPIEPEELILQRLLKLNSLLTWMFLVILLLICGFVFKHFLQAVIAVQRIGISESNLVLIIKHGFLEFFNSFGPLTGKYMLLATIWLFLVLMSITIGTHRQFLRSRATYILIMILATMIAFMLPVEKFYTNLAKGGQSGQVIILCLIFMIPGPYILGSRLGKHALSSLLYKKLFYILVFGLLLVQLFLEG